MRTPGESAAALNPSSSGPDLAVEMMTVTPEMAREWLATSRGNRQLSRRLVDKLVADIKAGRWQSKNGATICFVDGAFLVDGHHRLTAIAEAGIPVCVLVILDVEGVETIDGGLRRTAAHTAHMIDRIPNAVQAMSIAQALIELNGGSEKTFYEERKAIYDCDPERIQHVARSYARLKSYASAAFVFAWPVNPAEMQRAFDTLRSGVGMSPSLAAAHSIINERGARRIKSAYAEYGSFKRTRALQILHALQAELEGRQIKHPRPFEGVFEWWLKQRARVGAPIFPVRTTARSK